MLRALRDRNDLDTGLLDDVVVGCAQPVGEQGGVIARGAIINAGYAQSVAGQQIHRFCASGLEAVNNITAQVMTGMSKAGIGGGVESMSRVFMGADSGAWSADPRVAFSNYFAPQGIGADIIATLDGFTRDDVDAYAAESQRRAAAAWKDKRFEKSIVPVTDVLGDVVLSHDEHMRPETTVESLGKLKAAFPAMAEMGFDAVASGPLSGDRGAAARAHRRQFQRHRRRVRRGAGRLQGVRRDGRAEAPGRKSAASPLSARSRPSC